MPEMPHSCKDHGKASLISGGNDFIVAHRSAGLDNSSRTGLCCSEQTVCKGEKCIGSDR